MWATICPLRCDTAKHASAGPRLCRGVCWVSRQLSSLERAHNTASFHSRVDRIFWVWRSPMGGGGMLMPTLLLGVCDVMDAAGGGAIVGGTTQWSKLTMAI